MSQREICWFNTKVEGGQNLTAWDTDQQKLFIEMLERSFPFILDRGTEAIWATIVLRQAYDVADWIVEKRYTSYEPRGYYCSDEAADMCVPYDASTWRDWVDKELWNCEHSSLSNEHIKSVAVNLVRRKHIKIPLNSGLPHYYWLLNGYRFADFCRIYACIEYIYDGKFNFHELEMTMKYHMDHVMRAKTLCGFAQPQKSSKTCTLQRSWRRLYSCAEIGSNPRRPSKYSVYSGCIEARR